MANGIAQPLLIGYNRTIFLIIFIIALLPRSGNTNELNDNSFDLHLSSGLPYLARVNFSTPAFLTVPKLSFDHRVSPVTEASRLGARYDIENLTINFGVESGRFHGEGDFWGQPYSWLGAGIEVVKRHQFNCCQQLGWQVGISLGHEFRMYDDEFLLLSEEEEEDSSVIMLSAGVYWQVF